MRAASLLLLALVTGLVTGCGTEPPRVADEEVTAVADSMLERDLTLQTSAAPALEVASPVELTRQAPAPDSKPVHPTEPVTPPTAVSPEESAPSAPAMLRAAAFAKARADRTPLNRAPPELAVEERAVEEPATEEPPALEPETPVLPAGAGRELAPGKTVTVIPAAGGPSIEADADDSWLPSEHPRGIIGAGGGTCRPRGGVRGVGIAGRIPVGIPTRRLR
jgi:hypothetical protein